MEAGGIADCREGGGRTDAGGLMNDSNTIVLAMIVES